MRGVALHLILLLSGNQTPELVDVDGRAVKLVQGLVEVTHTNFAEITRMAEMQGKVDARENVRTRTAQQGGISSQTNKFTLPVESDTITSNNVFETRKGEGGQRTICQS